MHETIYLENNFGDYKNVFAFQFYSSEVSKANAYRRNLLKTLRYVR